MQNMLFVLLGREHTLPYLNILPDVFTQKAVHNVAFTQLHASSLKQFAKLSLCRVRQVLLSNRFSGVLQRYPLDHYISAPVFK